MAKEKKEKGGEEELVDDKTKSPDAEEEGVGSDAEKDREKDASESKEKRGILKGKGIRKWWLPGLLIFIFLAGGAAALLKPDLLNIINGKKKAVLSVDITNDNLQEESLSPFFIPPSSDLSKGAIRVDLSVIWDGLASIRYKDSELRIRSEIYDYLRKVAAETDDLNSQKTAMEEEMSGIFRKSLGIKDLAIRIKELKFI